MESEIFESQIELFKTMKSPFRPHTSEIRILREVVFDKVESQKITDFKVLVLGATEEITSLDWPEGTTLTAVDCSKVMIDAFWPGDVPGRRKVICADWFDMPFTKNSFHFIVGDGVFNFMSYPEGYRTLAGYYLVYFIRTDKFVFGFLINWIKKKSRKIFSVIFTETSR